MLSLSIPQSETFELQIAPAWIREEPAISAFAMGTRFVEISYGAKVAP